jgi:hypothetical protein
MAEISPSADTKFHYSLVTWEGATNGGTPDTFAPIEIQRRPYTIMVEAAGTFGASASIALHGSLDGVNYYALDDADGTAIALASAGLASGRDGVRFLKPVLASGDGSTDIDVKVLLWFESR